MRHQSIDIYPASRHNHCAIEGKSFRIRPPATVPFFQQRAKTKSSLQMPPPSMHQRPLAFDKEEKVLCYHGPLLYEAKVRFCVIIGRRWIA